jgi:hypothetical protein
MYRHIEESNFYNDGRVRAGQRGDWWQSLDERRMQATITVTSDDGDTEWDEEVPFNYGVCPTCDGTGSHVNPSVDAGGISAEDFYEDPGFAEDYMAGVYNVPCYQCKGRRVVPVMARDNVKPEILALLDAEEEAREESRFVRESERRYGA